MATAPTPIPQYIDLDNVKGDLVNLLGDKILFVDDLSTDRTAINETLGNELVAMGEAKVLLDLSPYYITDPALITTKAGDWTTLPAYTYNILYKLFVYSACLEIIGNFIARNTDETGRTLSYFQKWYSSEYNSYVNRIIDVLPNGGYKYILTGLQPLNTGIPRTVKTYAISGQLGLGNYSDRQVTNAEKNFQGNLPFFSN